MMARFRRGGQIRPVHSIKHIVDSSATLTAGTTLLTKLIDTVDAPIITGIIQCETGSKVNGIFLNVQVASNETDAGAIPNVYMALYKNPNGNITTINPTSTGDTGDKRFIFHQEMIMFNNLAGGNPRTLFKGVIAIPKGYRVNRFDDELVLAVRSTAVNIALCIQCIYKEYR